MNCYDIDTHSVIHIPVKVCVPASMEPLPRLSKSKEFKGVCVNRLPRFIVCKSSTHSIWMDRSFSSFARDYRVTDKVGTTWNVSIYNYFRWVPSHC